MINLMGLTEKQLGEAVRLYEEKHSMSIMTRAEAIALLEQHMPFTGTAIECIDFYIAAGMLKVKQSPDVQKLCSYESNELGLLKIERWPEGIVIWIAGKIKYKSWEDINNS